jgi:hypothetical protein
MPGDQERCAFLNYEINDRTHRDRVKGLIFGG